MLDDFFSSALIAGIGLALVHELTLLHGGSVRVSSVVGSGTTFLVSIPTGSAHLPRDRVGSAEEWTAVFAGSMLPMLVKAARTRDLSSYSIGNLVLANIGNAVHSVYVFPLPPGPIWVLHTFYLVSSALMLHWYLRYRAAARADAGRPAAVGAQR